MQNLEDTLSATTVEDPPVPQHPKDEYQLWQMSVAGNYKMVQRLLKNQDMNINWGNPDEYGPTALHKACVQGHTEVAILLLADRRIDVNKKDAFGWAPFALACANNRADIVSMMLEDNRVDINLGNRMDQTPLWIATYWGNLEIVKRLLATDRKINDFTASRRIAREKEISNVLELIREYDKDVKKVKERLKGELRLGKYFVAELFALIVMYCDGYLQLSQQDNSRRIQQFYKIAKCLPLDIQQILCNRTCQQTSNFVYSKELEPALRKVVEYMSRERKPQKK